MKKNTVLLIFLFIWLSPSLIFSQKRGGEEFPELKSGIPVSGMVRTGSSAWYTTYRIRITPEMTGFRIFLEDAPADLDLYLRYGSPMEDYSQADVYSETDYYNEELALCRYDDSGMENGYAYVDVAYMFEMPPVLNQEVMKDIPYVIRFEAVYYKLEEVLPPGKFVKGLLKPQRFMVQTFPVAIPSDADFLRIDLTEATGDLDVMVSALPVVSQGDFPLIKEESVLGNESVLMTVSDRYRGKTLYVSVFDPIASDREQGFRIIAGFSKDPGWDLPALPDFSGISSYEQNIRKATVELITPSGGGSGTIVSSGGIILTNYHVLMDLAGGIHKTAVVAVVDDLFQPARETYRAEVLEASEELDCAVLGITSGYYHQKLPEDYSFPFYRFRNAQELELGDEIRILGFPAIGGSGSRATLNLSRGILSGGERVENRIVLKTDAKISSGNSGGAATDEHFRLLGIPSFVIEEGGENIGYIIPLSTLPGSWVRRYFPTGLFP